MNRLEETMRDRLRVFDLQDGTGRFAISTPMYKVEGGLYEVYLVPNGVGGYVLSDEGSTWDELDRVFELAEPDVIKNLVAILRQYGCKKVGTAIQIDCQPTDVHVKMSYLIQAMSFMLNMKIFYV